MGSCGGKEAWNGEGVLAAASTNPGTTATGRTNDGSGCARDFACVPSLLQEASKLRGEFILAICVPRSRMGCASHSRCASSGHLTPLHRVYP